MPYLLVGVVLVVLAFVIARFPLPAMGTATSRVAKAGRRNHSLWAHRNLIFGVGAIFIYLIAEIGDMTTERAGRYLTLLWGGMMVGRFVGSASMQPVPGGHRAGGLFGRRVRDDGRDDPCDRAGGDVVADPGRAVPSSRSAFAGSGR